MTSDSEQSILSQEILDHLLEKTSRSFALSIPMLPEPLRREVTVAYLLFRIADTLEDATLWDSDKRVVELQEFAALLADPSLEHAEALAARWTKDPPLDHAGYLELLSETPALIAALIELYGTAGRLICEHAIRTTERMVSFVAQSDEAHVLQLTDLSDLQAYCYAVAGIVGEMLTELFLLKWPELHSIGDDLRRDAAVFGEALQLVNILKDSAFDAAEGRNYLPGGVDRAELFALAQRDLEIAGRYVRNLQEAGADKGVLAFTASPVLLAWPTLQAVEKRGPGSKISRLKVAKIIVQMKLALRLDRPVIPDDLAEDCRIG